MNLAIRGIEAQIEFGDSFRNDRHPDLKGRLHPGKSSVQHFRLER